MKIKLWFLFIGLLILTSCGTVKQGKKTAITKVPKEAMLSPEQQRRYEYFFLEASRLKAKGEYDAAFDMLKHSLAINPSASSALYEISKYYLLLKLIPQGQVALEAAVESSPDNYWYSQTLVNLYLQQRQQEKAIDLLEAMAVRFPERRETQFTLLDLYNQQQNYAKVIAILDRLEGELGKSEQLTMEKFRIYLQMKDNKTAFQEIEGLVNEYPLDTRYQVVLGDVYLQNGKREEAYNMYQKVLAADPNNVLAHLSLASYYDEIGEKDLYKQQLDSLLLNKEIPVEAKLDVMRQVIAQNEQTGADSTQVIGIFDHIMQQDPDDDQIPMLYSQYLWAKNMKEASVPVLERVVQIDPTNKAARLMLLEIAIQKADFQQVIKICEPGIEVSPEALEFYFYLAIAYNQAQKSDDVLAVCQKALEHITSDSRKEIVSDFYSIIGDAYHTKEMMTEAYNAYDSALVYNPSNIGALNNYAYYLSVEKRDLDRAEEMSYKTVKAEPNNATFLDTYAWILFVKGNYAEARIYIDNAMKADGDKSDTVVEHCGDIYYMSGDVDGALKYWQQALDMGSESKILKEKIKKKKYIAE